MNIWQLSYEQQLALLKLRGIAGINLNYVEYKVALPILMIVYLVKAINPRYNIGKLMKSVRKFATSDSEA